MNLFLSPTTNSHGQPAGFAQQGMAMDKNRGMTARNDGALPGAPVS